MKFDNVFRGGAPYNCPHCGYKHTASASVGSGDRTQPPKTGDVSICVSCGRISCFKCDGSLRLPTKSEVSVLVVTNPDVLRIILSIVLANSHKPIEERVKENDRDTD